MILRANEGFRTDFDFSRKEKDMTAEERKFLEMTQRVVKFGLDHALDFPVGSAGRGGFDMLTAMTDRLFESASEKLARGANTRQKVTVKAISRDALDRDLRAIQRTAKILAKRIPGIDGKFALPARLGDQDFLMNAISFATGVEPYVADFVAYSLPPNFLDTLRANLAAFETALRERRDAGVSRADVNRNIGAMMAECAECMRELDVVVRNAYAGNSVKLEAWATARRLPRNPVRTKTPEAPAPAPPMA